METKDHRIKVENPNRLIMVFFIPLLTKLIIFLFKLIDLARLKMLIKVLT